MGTKKKQFWETNHVFEGHQFNLWHVAVLILFLLPGLAAGCKNELNPGQHINEPISTLVPFSMHTSTPTVTEMPQAIATFVSSQLLISKEKLTPLAIMPPEVERYSLKNTFSDLGVPLNLRLQFSLPPQGPPQQPVDYSLWVNYDNEGLQEVYLGDMKNQKVETTICPEQPFQQVMLYLFSPDLKFIPWGRICLSKMPI